MLELTIILDSNARNPFFFFFIIFYVRPLFAQTRWVKRTRRRNPFTLGDTEKLKLNFAWVVRLFSLSHWCSSSCSLSSPRAEHTTHCREEQHNSSHKHTHTWKKEINESYANVAVDDSHCCCALSVSLCVSFALLCAAQLEIGTRWRGHRLDALSGNAALCICSQRMSAHFQLVCNTACPCANDFIVGPRKKEQKNEVTTPHRITKTRQQSRKQKQATIITDHPQSMA